MIADRKKFYTGLGLLAGFVVILAIIFSPVFGGRNGLDYLDSLDLSDSPDPPASSPKARTPRHSGKALHPQNSLPMFRPLRAVNDREVKQ